METQEYVENKKSIQLKFLEFIDNENNTEENYQDLLKLIRDQKILEDFHEVKALLHLISKVSNNHHRSSKFFSKIQKLLLYLQKKGSKHTMSKINIFDIFHNNKKLLPFLFEQKFIEIDYSIYQFYMQPKYQKLDFPLFLINNLRKTIKNSKIRELLKKQPENFEEKQKMGENESKICEIIRKDSIEEFIEYREQTNLTLDSKIERSIFETNSILMKNDPTIIEYAAFFGSIKIIKYLQENNVKLTPSLWIYSIHSNNSDLIQFLEENQIEPEDKNYEKCVKEAIKCHHNEIASYIKEKFIPKDGKVNEGEEPTISFEMIQKLYSYAIRYYNYSLFETKYKNKLNFIYFCMYDYFYIVSDTLKNNQINVTAILNRITSLYGAAQKNNYEILNLLLTQPKAKIIKDTFIYCTRLTEVKIPSQITFIGEKAFKGCSALKNVSIASSVTIIDSKAFEICSALEEIKIPSSVVTLGKSVFSGCKSLTKVCFEKNSSLKSISVAAFSGCISLVDINIPSSVTIIEKSAFTSCSSLKSIVIPSLVTDIDEGSFQLCSSLAEIVFQKDSSLRSIKEKAFKSCSSLVNITLPSSIKNIGENAFLDCTSLEKILIPSSLNKASEENLPSKVHIEKF